MDNQTAFLKNIRTALGQAADSERSKRICGDLFAPSDTKETLDKIRNRSETEKEKLANILLETGNALKICTHITQSMDEAAAVIVELIRSKEPEFTHNKHIVLHDHPDIAALKLWNRFSREAVTIHTTFSSDQQALDKTIASFIGITAPAIGVADSATLVEQTKPGRPRSTSLVPSIHIALLRRENLVANLTEAYALMEEKKHLQSFVFVTGPSKTADIEAHLVHGAHGPCEVHLIVLSEPIPERVPEPAPQLIAKENPEESLEHATLSSEEDE